jgi:hypothetical protein
MEESIRTCPRCGGTRSAEGNLGVGEHGIGFHPAAIRLSSVSSFRCVPYVNDKASACLDCGLVWNEISLEGLNDLLNKYTTKEERQQLFAEHKPPPSDPFQRDKETRE